MSGFEPPPNVPDRRTDEPSDVDGLFVVILIILGAAGFFAALGVGLVITMHVFCALQEHFVCP